ncbi:MAG: hypothetical protein WB565_07215 [Acidimicrobiales bacterium]
MAEAGLKATWKVTKWWLIAAIVLVVPLYCIVWGLSGSWDYAFEVVTGTSSPFKMQNVGPAGGLLGFVGYLLIPVVIGAVASVWFSMNVRRVFGTDLAKQVLDQVAKEVAADKAAREAGSP